MCVLVAWLQQIPGHPLVVAANRDERLSRPAIGPLFWQREGRGSGTDGESGESGATGTALVAPRDEVAGGTWWAVSETGLFVGITNRAGRPPDLSRRSRGLLVLDVARSGILEKAETLLRSLNPEEHNGFHLIAATTTGAVRAVNFGDRIEVVRLEPGLHVISERSFGALEPSRDDVVFSVFESLPRDRLHVDRITRALGTHGDDPWRSVCVHPDLPDYGTRSSSILAFADEPERSLLLHADGPPCTTELEDRSGLLRSLLAMGGADA